MTVQEIADHLRGNVLGDCAIQIYGVANLRDASQTDLCFADGGHLQEVPDSLAGCVLVPRDASMTRTVIQVNDPKTAFARAAELLIIKETAPIGVHATAIVADDAILGKDISIGPYSVIESGVHIGDRTTIASGCHVGQRVRLGTACQIFPNVTLYHDIELHDRVIIHAGAVIGADGFGYVHHQGRYIKMPHVAKVILHNDVEIGANTCIDRGSLNNTIIEQGTKIDNLCQIAHNVLIGAQSVIAAQTGISGSCIIGDHCQIGGQVGFGDHAKVEAGVSIGGQAGILPNEVVKRPASKSAYFGTPILPERQQFRMYSNLKKLAAIYPKIKHLVRGPEQSGGDPDPNGSPQQKQ